MLQPASPACHKLPKGPGLSRGDRARRGCLACSCAGSSAAVACMKPTHRHQLLSIVDRTGLATGCSSRAVCSARIWRSRRCNAAQQLSRGSAALTPHPWTWTTFTAAIAALYRILFCKHLLRDDGASCRWPGAGEPPRAWKLPEAASPPHPSSAPSAGPPCAWPCQPPGPPVTAASPCTPAPRACKATLLRSGSDLDIMHHVVKEGCTYASLPSQPPSEANHMQVKAGRSQT